MSFDLSFFSNSNKATSSDIENALKDSAKNELNWPTNTKFCEFVKSLHQELTAFDSAMIVNQGSAEQGYLCISLQGPSWLDAHHEIGGLLMMHNVICYDHQSGQATLELEQL